MSITAIRLSSLPIALIFLTVLVACSHAPVNHSETASIIDLASTNLPDVAAEFTTSREGEESRHDEHPSDAYKVVWRFWRTDRQITIETPELRIGELWQRDGGSVIHRKLYHGDRRAIEFQDDDLRMLETTPPWRKLALLLDPKLLTQLSAGEVEWSEGYPVREYRGTVADTDWHVVMRMDLGLPQLIERRHENVSERTELLQANRLDAAPWQPTSTSGYDVIDFADLGDKEYDPFVIKVQAQMGHDHHH